VSDGKTVKLFFCTMKTYGDVKAQPHAFLIPARDGGEWSASRLGRFISGERVLITYWTGGWVVPRVSLEAVVKRKNSHHCLCRESKPNRSARSVVTYFQRYLRTK